MNRRKIGIGAAIGLVVGALTGCTPSGVNSSASEDGLQTVRVAYSKGSATLPVHLAQTQGIFEKHGLKIEATYGTDFPTYIAALGRQFDISLGSAGNVFPAMTKLPVVAVAGMQVNVADPKNSVVVTNNPSINGIEDLVGKRIGVAIVTGANPQSINYLLKQKGLDPASVQYVQVGFAEQGDQLAAGNVDAVVSAIPFWSALEQSGMRVIFDVYYEAAKAATGAEESANAFWVSTEDYVKEKPGTVQAFHDALAESIEFMHENKEIAQKELHEWLGMDEALLKSAPIPAVSAEINKELLEPLLIISESNGVVKKGEINLDEHIWKKE